MLDNKIVKALFPCLLGAFFLAACSAPPRPIPTYTNASGAVMTFENDRESCVSACNEEFDRCGEMLSAQEPAGRGQLAAVLGGEGDCRDALKSCINDCRRR